MGDRDSKRLRTTGLDCNGWLERVPTNDDCVDLNEQENDDNEKEDGD